MTKAKSKEEKLLDVFETYLNKGETFYNLFNFMLNNNIIENIERDKDLLDKSFRTYCHYYYLRRRYFDFIEVIKFRPYWMYTSVIDQRTNRIHSALNNIVLHYTDSFWLNFFPPNDFGCRCMVRSLSERELKRKNVDVVESKEIKNFPLNKYWNFNIAEKSQEEVHLMIADYFFNNSNYI